MITHLCPDCGRELQLVKSGDYGYCHSCSTAISASRGNASVFAYAPIGHSRPHPSGLTLGRQARDEGTALVLENAGQEWRDRIAFLIDGLARRLPEFTADDVRAEAERVELDPPHHHNAWGAALLSAARRGSIRRTMTLRPSTRREANAHGNPIWLSLIYEPEQAAPLPPLYEPSEVW